MTEVNVSTTVGMSATVGGNVRNSGGECPQQWGEMSATVGGDVRDSGGNVCNSGQIKHDLANSRGDIVIHNSAKVTYEDTWNNM